MILRMEQLPEQRQEGSVLFETLGLGRGSIQKKNQDTLKINPTTQSQQEPIVSDSEILEREAVVPSQEEIRMEWKFAANVVDRLALLISVLFAIVSTVVLLVSAM
jgi:hypothetical protein